MLFDLLRHRVGSPISYQSLAEDIGISPATVKKYIEILAAVYVIFMVRPFSHNIARSLLKEPKIYFFDTALVEAGPEAKFENLVAVSLLKDIYAREDQLAEELNLYYLRTKDGEEVDFAIARRQDLEIMIEVKLSDRQISKNLLKFKKRYHFESLQLVQFIDHDYRDKDISVLNANQYLKNLFL